METFSPVFPRHGKPSLLGHWTLNIGYWILNLLLLFPLLLAPLLLSSCSRAPAPRVAHLLGRTMGTTYSIRIAAPLSPRKQQRLQAQIDAALDEVNRQMSTYRPDSEISRFNLSPPNQPLPNYYGPGLHGLRMRKIPPPTLHPPLSTPV